VFPAAAAASLGGRLARWEAGPHGRHWSWGRCSRCRHRGGGGGGSVLRRCDDAGVGGGAAVAVGSPDMGVKVVAASRGGRMVAI